MSVLTANALAMASVVAHQEMLCSLGRSFVVMIHNHHASRSAVKQHPGVGCKGDSHLHASFSAFIKELTRSISSFLVPSCHQHCPHVCLLSLKPALRTQGVSTTALIVNVFAQMLPYSTTSAHFMLCAQCLCWHCRIGMFWLMSFMFQDKHM